MSFDGQTRWLDVMTLLPSPSSNLSAKAGVFKIAGLLKTLPSTVANSFDVICSGATTFIAPSQL